MASEPRPQTIVLPLLLFAISMGFLESVLVIYLRELFYPGGFVFPLKPIPEWLLYTEMAREACTITMLLAVAWISGTTWLRRLSSFLFIFGVWDIFYYTGLWLALGWPQSLLTWDLLFLIPVAWTSPVLAPMICSLTMIGMAVLFEWNHYKGRITKLRKASLILFSAGASLIFISFIYDYTSLLMKGNYLKQIFNLNNNTRFIQDLTSFIPSRFQWELFGSGMFLILAGVGFVVEKLMLNKSSGRLNGA